MNEPTPLSDLVADDLLLDALGRRADCGHDPLVSVLGALAAHADSPLSGATSRRRGSRKRIFSTFAVLAVGATGAGVAAAVTLPHAGAGHEAPEIHRARPGVPAVTATQAAPLLAGVADAGPGRWTVITDPDGSVEVVLRSGPDPAKPGAAAGSATAGAGASGSGSPSPEPTGPTRSNRSPGSSGSTAAPKGQVDKTARPAPGGDKTATPGKQDPPPPQDESGDAVQPLVGPNQGTPSPTPRGTGGGSSSDGQAAQSQQPATRKTPAPDQTPGVVPDAASSADEHRATAPGALPEQAAIPPAAAAPGAGSAGSAPENMSANAAPAVKVPFLPSASAPLPSAFLPYLPFPTGR